MEALIARDGPKARLLGQRHVRLAAEAALGLLSQDEVG